MLTDIQQYKLASRYHGGQDLDDVRAAAVALEAQLETTTETTTVYPAGVADTLGEEGRARAMAAMVSAVLAVMGRGVSAADAVDVLDAMGTALKADKAAIVAAFGDTNVNLRLLEAVAKER
jgi:hypothetical protein